LKNTSPNKKLFSLNRQPLVLLIFSSVSFLLILFRLIFLQLLNYESFKKMSDENRIRLIATQPIRGRIIDKNGFVLADSRVKYSLIIKPQSVKKIIEKIRENKIIYVKNKFYEDKDVLDSITENGPAIILKSSGSSGKPRQCFHHLNNLKLSATTSGQWLIEQGFELHNCLILNTLPLNHIS